MQPHVIGSHPPPSKVRRVPREHVFAQDGSVLPAELVLPAAARALAALVGVVPVVQRQAVQRQQVVVVELPPVPQVVAVHAERARHERRPAPVLHDPRSDVSGPSGGGGGGSGSFERVFLAADVPLVLPAGIIRVRDMAR
ncbi:hypothetical protein UCREL1_8307 [Eutypa lata UCREL1]|uniref:Uncharacterized protein n=1 Tax=Eutypa lata (strain UCR-EL1) TaxID=1287681 RepID=M7SEP2_EUTLA|nr:hypothetical protein UCREL1_8307 [Eutypa lata UCREL1]